VERVLWQSRGAGQIQLSELFNLVR